MFRLLLSLLLISILSIAQTDLHNDGSSLTLFIGEDHVVHVEGSITNDASATIEFENSTGTPLVELTGDFTNSTSGTYTMGKEDITFLGTSTQNADWGGDTFYRATINNSTNVNLSRDALTNNGITFTDGDLNTTSTEVLTFDTAATHTGAADASHINGPTAKNFNSTTEFEFPVGNGIYYRDIYLQAESTTATNYEIDYYRVQYSDTSTDGTIDHISRREYYTIDRNSGSEDATIRMTWRSNSEVTTTGDLVVAYYNGVDWSSAGGNNITGTATSGSIESNANWSTWANRPFTLASTTSNNPLPVEMLSFTAEALNDKSLIQWTTATEINSDYFSIMYSTDGESFIEIGTIDAAGNSSDLIDYSFIHDNPNTGMVYYKIVNHDLDGSNEETQKKSVYHSGNKMNISELSKLYPNPTDGNVNIDYYSLEEGTIQIMVYDQIGNVVYHNFKQINTGLNITTIPSETFASGNYYVKILDTENTAAQQFRFTKIK